MDATDQFLTIPQDDDSLQGESNRHDGHGHAYTSSQDDELYLERLETLYEKQLGEIDTFAIREGRPCEDVRKSIAQWYSKTLFDFTSTTQQDQDQKAILSATMRSVSDTLESLQVVAGYQSFFLTVNPSDKSDEGFLGGTILGREFWRGHRGCGAAGALAFKLYCQKATNVNSPSGSSHKINEDDSMSQMIQKLQSTITQPIGVAAYPANVPTTMAAGSSNTPKKNQASAIKAEVYASVRSAIRTVTGHRNAEMKWSNHDRLVDSYGVRLEGWPASVPKQNPSVLSAAQNKAILDALEDGSMRFVSVKAAAPDPDSGNGVGEEARNRERMQREREIFEDAVDFTAGQGGREDASVEHRSAESTVGESGGPRSASLVDIAAQQNNQVGGDMTPGALQLVWDMETLEEVDRGVGIPKETTPSRPASSNTKVPDEADEADGTGTRKRRRVGHTVHM